MLFQDEDVILTLKLLDFKGFLRDTHSLFAEKLFNDLFAPLEPLFIESSAYLFLIVLVIAQLKIDLILNNLDLLV